MFENIGGKIKKIAIVSFWLELAGFFILSMCMFFSSVDAYGDERDLFELLGWIFLLAGPGYAYLSSLLMCGFARLIENSDSMLKLNKSVSNMQNVSNTDKVQRKCEVCGSIINEETCPICNKNKIDALNKWKENGLISEEEYYNKMESLNNE